MTTIIKRAASSIAHLAGLERGNLRAPFQLKMGCIFNQLKEHDKMESIVCEAIHAASQNRLQKRFSPHLIDPASKIVEKAVTKSIATTVSAVLKKQTEFQLVKLHDELTPPLGFVTADPKFYAFDGKFKPSETISALFFQNPSLDSAAFIQVVYLKAILDVIGAEKFDAIFSHEPLKIKLTQIGYDWLNPLSFFTEFLTSEITATSFDPITFGSKVNFCGVKWDSARHPSRWPISIQVLRVDAVAQPLFFGLGMNFPTTGDDICHQLVEEYAKMPSEDDRLIFSKISKENYLGYLFKTQKILKNYQDETLHALLTATKELPVEEKLHLITHEVGFSGMQDAEKLSYKILGKMIEWPIEKIKHPSFIESLTRLQLEEISRFLIEAPDRIVNKEEPMGKAFIDWFDKLG
jgi:hypothetical protein